MGNSCFCFKELWQKEHTQQILRRAGAHSQSWPGEASAGTAASYALLNGLKRSWRGLMARWSAL